MAYSFFFLDTDSLAIHMLLPAIGGGLISYSLQNLMNGREGPKIEAFQKTARIIFLILLLFLLISTISFFIFIHLFFSN